MIASTLTVPPGYWLGGGGQVENYIAARQRLAIVVPACFALIFFLLYGALGSARDAILVFNGVPLALTGGILALWLRAMPFSISAAGGHRFVGNCGPQWARHALAYSSAPPKRRGA